MAKQTKSKFHKVGGVWQNPENKKFSLSMKLAEPATLKVVQGNAVVEVELVPNNKGYVTLWLQKPEEELNALVANNIISEEVAMERKESLPTGLKYNVILPPARD